MMSPQQIQLRGITWDHSRGHTSVVAATQRFHELHPSVDVHWDKRSLLEFGEQSLERLVENYDLLVIDHPYIGEAAGKGFFCPLNDHMEPEVLDDFQANGVGPSFESYVWEGRLFAIPIDVACPVAAWREDILQARGLRKPDSWQELIEWAHSGDLIYPGCHTDAIHHFYMLCHTLGSTPFEVPKVLAPRDVISSALEHLRELARAAHPLCQELNPIQVFDRLANTNDFVYCPFAFGYSNYGRRHYGKNLLKFGPPPTYAPGGVSMRTTLGGCGMAVSALSAHPDLAAHAAVYTGSAQVQMGLYTQAGGQPAHRTAWEVPQLDDLANGFFGDTLAVHEACWLRPRHHGYLHFQDKAAYAIHRCQTGRQSVASTVVELNDLLAESFSSR